MSAGIEKHDTITLGSGMPAWHGLGKVFPGRLSPMRAHVEGVGAQEIIEVPVLADGLEIPNMKGLVARLRDGTKVPLWAAKKTYGVLQDRDFFEILETVYEGRPVVETAGTLFDCRRIWVLVQRDEWSVTKGDEIKTYDLWVNRHDGTGCFELHTTMVRVVCANTWSMAIGNGENRVFGVRHTSGVLEGARAAANLLMAHRKMEKDYRDSIKKLTQVRVTLQDVVPVFQRLLNVDLDKPMSKRTEEKVELMSLLFKNGAGNEGRTAWDGFNAVTEYVDHGREMRIRTGRVLSEARFDNVLMGGGDHMKSRALELFSSLS